MPPLKTIGIKINHVYSFFNLKVLLETTYPMEVFSAIEIIVPITVTATDINAALRIVIRSFHKNSYAEADKACGNN